MTTLNAHIRALSLLPGVSGHEDAVRDYLRAALAGADCHCETDRLGNLLVHKRGAQPARHSLLLCAHMDEPGLMLTEITEEGFLHFDPVGKPERRCLPGKQVELGALRGVIGNRALHLIKREELKKLPDYEALYIDIGAPDGERARSCVRLGEVACFRRHCDDFGAGLLKGSALASRIPCGVLLSLLLQDSPVDYHAAFTVQKEVGSRGAFGLGFRLRTERSLVLDCSPACDVPEGPKEGLRLGEGIGISLRDEGALYSRPLAQELLALAAREGLSARLLFHGDSGQGKILQQAGPSTAAVALRVPLRYINTPSSVAHPGDAAQLLRLLEHYLRQEVTS